MIPLGKPFIPGGTWKDIRSVLESGQLVEGGRCADFARALSAITGSPHVVLINSGTSALYLALRALGIGPGDAVLVPAYSFPATANAVAWAGAVPVFADVNPSTWNMDADTAQAAAAALDPGLRRRIKAVMPVQAFGNPVDMPPLLALARRRGWRVVEDAACALGSRLEGRACGTHGDIGCFSFHPRKILTTSEGGALITASPRLAAELALLKNHGMLKASGKVRFLKPGLNLRFTEISAAMGLAQLRVLPALVKERQSLAGRYAAGLRAMGLSLQESVSGGDANRQSLVARLPFKSIGARDRFIAAMASRNIQVNIGTYYLPDLPAFAGKQAAGAFPAAAGLFRQAMAFPFYNKMGGRVVDQVLEALRRELP